jgi:hypothetical protein
VVSGYLLAPFRRVEQVFLSTLASFDSSDRAVFTDYKEGRCAAKQGLLQSEGLRESGGDSCGPFFLGSNGRKPIRATRCPTSGV